MFDACCLGTRRSYIATVRATVLRRKLSFAFYWKYTINLFMDLVSFEPPSWDLWDVGGDLVDTPYELRNGTCWVLICADLINRAQWFYSKESHRHLKQRIPRISLTYQLSRDNFFMQRKIQICVKYSQNLATSEENERFGLETKNMIMWIRLFCVFTFCVIGPIPT
jgi:hypothetical protein